MKFKQTALAVMLAAASMSTANADAAADLSARLEAMQKEIEQLKQQLAAESATRKAQLKSVEDTVHIAKAEDNKNHFGGYGELHYNNLENQKPGGADKDEMDLHRFVLFFGHDFNDRLRFRSELEVEHAFIADKTSGSGTPGEVEVEQAYVEYDVSNMLSVRGGLFLVPVGFLNENHEPPVFYGVERNPVESNIIPSTWWEGGAGLTARLGDGLTLDAAYTSGLKTGASSNYAVRSGRQKGAKAAAQNGALTARLKWNLMPGLDLAGAVQRQGDITQGADPAAGGAWLYEAHGAWNRGPFTLKALYARWSLDGSGPASVGADRQDGWYVEPSYKLNKDWGLFARYNRWDNQAGDSADSQYDQIDVGVNYWPHPDVVVKLDYQNQSAPAGKDEFDGFNLGVGYQF